MGTMFVMEGRGSVERDGKVGKQVSCSLYLALYLLLFLYCM